MARSKTKASRTKSAPTKKTAAKKARPSAASTTTKKTRKRSQTPSQLLEAPQSEEDSAQLARAGVDLSPPLGDPGDSDAVEEAVASDPMIVTLDRRRIPDRRSGVDRRQQNIPVAVERRQLERRAKVPRRRQIDPTTCERDYTPEEIEFMKALDEYKRLSGRMFPTCSEILEVLKKLGYEKRPQTPPEPRVTEGRSEEEEGTLDGGASSSQAMQARVAELPPKPTVLAPVDSIGDTAVHRDGLSQSETLVQASPPEQTEAASDNLRQMTSLAEGISPGSLSDDTGTPSAY